MSDAEGTQSGASTDSTQSGGAGSSGGNTSTEGTSGSTGTQSGTSSTTSTTEDDKVSRQDYDAIRERMKGADQRAAKFEAELKALRDKDLPEAEKMKAEYEAATQRVSKLETDNRRLSLENAFLKDNTHEWKNPATALKLVDLSGVSIDDDGHVIGLKDALKKLANSEPYLLKEKSASEGAANGGASSTAPTAPAGAPPMNGRTNTDAGANKGMEVRIPALNTRRRPRAS